jgi:hypothetical protein
MDDPAIRALIEEAAWWRLLGLLFERPRGGWREEVAALAAEVGDPDLRAAAGAAATAAEGPYLRLLGPGGDVSPREAAHRGAEDPARTLSGLAALYGAFAYRPRAEDPPDHVAVEAGFAGYLRLKEAYARGRGDPVAAEDAASAHARFVATHLRALAGPLGRRLAAAGASWLALAALCLVSRAGNAPDPPPAPDPDEASPLPPCMGDPAPGN